jgi:aspartate racemase
MKTIGLIGGLSWQSTQTYYQIINTEVNKQLGKNHSAKIILYSFDFEEIEFLQRRAEWEDLNNMIVSAGKSLENAGADCLMICSNTMHKCASQLEKEVNVPLLHIVDAVGNDLSKKDVKKAGLLGTKFLMESDTYTEKLKHSFHIETFIPDPGPIQEINNIIYSELVKGKINDKSRKHIISIIHSMMKYGIEAIILGCTEIQLLINQDDCEILVFDTTEIHACRAANFIISK